MIKSPKIIVSTGAGAGLMAIVMTAVTPQLQKFEGTRYTPYRDVGGVLTVCSGHTGPDVVVGHVYTPAQCSALTEQDAAKAAQGVLKYSPQMLYHPMQLAALISFSYNVGVGSYSTSSVRVNFDHGDFKAGCADLLKYVNVNGKYNSGLANRRTQEYSICMSTLSPGGLANVGVAPSTTS